MHFADPCGREVSCESLQPIACWDYAFESRRGYGYLFLVNIVRLSGRGLCDGPITRPKESNRLCCVTVCDLETSSMRRPWPALGCYVREREREKRMCMLSDAVSLYLTSKWMCGSLLQNSKYPVSHLFIRLRGRELCKSRTNFYQN